MQEAGVKAEGMSPPPERKQLLQPGEEGHGGDYLERSPGQQRTQPDCGALAERDPGDMYSDVTLLPLSCWYFPLTRPKYNTAANGYHRFCPFRSASPCRETSGQGSKWSWRDKEKTPTWAETGTHTLPL